MSRISVLDVQQRYNARPQIWPEEDVWNSTSRKLLERDLPPLLAAAGYAPDWTILNAGSAGNDYGVKSRLHIHADLAMRHLVGAPDAMVADLHHLPLKPGSVDLVMCMGSVINYCDLPAVVAEMRQALRPRGFAIFDFENTDSYEYYPRYAGKLTALQDTDYCGGMEPVWLFSERYVAETLAAAKFRVVATKYMHIFSILSWKLIPNERFASAMARLDPFFSLFPSVRRKAANIMVLCQKTD
ncbi:MAG TPA: methyltransferase domain-containing protein [Alphaproteobacteria bacterium]|nr:methyltransferase domain-containing protein [Alphaproteobacteria bacterium]